MDPTQLQRLARLSQSWGEAPFQVVESGGRGYRSRVRLSVRGKTGDCRIGIFEARSHRLVHIPHCPVHHPSIAELLPRLTEWVNTTGVIPYDESSHRGTLRAVQMAVERATQRVQVVLLLRDELQAPSLLPEELSKLSDLLAAHPRVQSVFWGALPERSNSLFAQRYHLYRGSETIRDSSAGATVHYPPGAFGQANLDAHDRVVQRIFEFVPEGARVFEYYCGVGSISLGLARRGHEVRFNELSPGSIQGLQAGWDELFGGMRPLELFEGPAGDYASAYGQQDVVIVDPPRKGLDGPLFDRLANAPPKRLIYLSCGLDSLERELSRLHAGGRFRLRHLSAWLYFPFTAHVETLVVLDADLG